MEKIVLVIGGLIKTYTLSDLFFFISGLILIALLVYIIYLMRTESDFIEKKTENKIKKEVSISEIVENLENDYELKPIDLTSYEKEQEDTAIISYDELIKRTSTNINYDDNYNSGFEDLSVKKITDFSNTTELVDLPKAIMISYEKEEEFLDALHKLQHNLTR